jgi:uncharacterized protein (TIGR02996 family)
MTSDESAFLAAIADNPADDTTRLVYADWLDEQPAVYRKCAACQGSGFEEVRKIVGQMGYLTSSGKIILTKPKVETTCSACGGDGKEPCDTSRRDRAEFIRVQIELSRMTPPQVLRPDRMTFEHDEQCGDLTISSASLGPFQIPRIARLHFRFGVSLNRGDVVDVRYEAGSSMFEAQGWFVDYVQTVPQADLLHVEVVVKGGEHDYYTQRARLTELRKRERELFDAHAYDWVRHLPGSAEGAAIHPSCVINCGIGPTTTHVFSYAFRRGFPERPDNITPEQWRLLHPPHSFKWEQIQQRELAPKTLKGIARMAT